jgi:hypothetical protein
MTRDSVTISTEHSVKGLDFACVFPVGFDYLETGRTGVVLHGFTTAPLTWGLR